MEHNINKFFALACSELQKSSGSFEFIETQGMAALKNKADSWISYGVTNLEEIYTNIDHILKLFISFNDYDDDTSQFMPDILAVLDDLAFHSSIFGVYFFLLDTLFDDGDISIEMSKNDTNSVDLDSYKKIVSEIAYGWDINLNMSEKIAWIKKVLNCCFEVKRVYSILFVDGIIFEKSKGRIFLKMFYSYILALQNLWAAL